MEYLVIGIIILLLLLVILFFLDLFALILKNKKDEEMSEKVNYVSLGALIGALFGANFLS